MPFSYKPDRAAIEGECPGGEVDHRLEHPVEVEGRRDLAADLEQQGEIAGPLLDGVQLGVPEGGGGAGGEPFQQLPVLLVEDPVAGELVDDLDGADGDPAATIAVAMTVVASISAESTRGS